MQMTGDVTLHLRSKTRLFVAWLNNNLITYNEEDILSYETYGML